MILASEMGVDGEPNLTYMLTGEEIEAAKARGDVIPVRPLVQWAPTPRVFLMAKILDEQIGTGEGDPETSGRWGRLRADIDHFVQGGYVNWGLMKWLDPKKFEHWTLKSIRPRPSLRVFGRFAQPNVFVGTHVIERAHLRGKWSIQYELEKLRCEDIWNEIFEKPPFSGADYEDYITEDASRDVRVQS